MQGYWATTENTLERPLTCLHDVRFGSKADMCSATRHVRFVPIADIGVVNPVLGSAIVWIMSTVASRADDSDMTLIERVKI